MEIPMPSQVISTGFTWDSTADEVIAGINLSGKRAVVTGGSSGIGTQTARSLASAGAEVVIAVRDIGAGDSVAAGINEALGRQAVSVAEVELADPASCLAFGAEWSGVLDILVNNAGIMAVQTREMSESGWELQFATNHLGHFALTLGLHPALKASGKARVVCLSSRGHLRSPVVFDDINFMERTYDPLLAYGQSKTANVLMAVEASRRWAADGIAANAVHPGSIRATRLGRHMSQQQIEGVSQTTSFRFKTIEQGAATSVLVAASPLLEGVGGHYFEDCSQSAVLGPEITDLNAEPRGVAHYAVDPENAHRLWELSLRALGVSE
jgi:NAD(P)-dependent dehydrogenase (short-subunit alcohol dehydrogenase family)